METSSWRDTVDAASAWLYEKAITGIDLIMTLWSQAPTLVSIGIALMGLIGLILLVRGGKEPKQEDIHHIAPIDAETTDTLHRIERKIDQLLERREQDRGPPLRASRNGTGDEPATRTQY